MDSILEVFIKISENEDIKITQLEKKIGASKGVLSRAIANNSDIQSKWLLKLVENYPQYNPEWLLTGKGEMLKETMPPAVSSSQSQENDKYTASLEKQVAQLEKINTLQEEKIKGLEQEVSQLKEDLELYIANSSGDILKSNAG